MPLTNRKSPREIDKNGRSKNQQENSKEKHKQVFQRNSVSHYFSKQDQNSDFGLKRATEAEDFFIWAQNLPNGPKSK